ncbi:uncharacterized protein B0I36DRAFT_329845 [Microdochium trichocladiopsis]|uniref:Uncharacterized protein n=1 Tax=Microdochium trichocladiopsis TaxID=1682393 RepID=A0A9P8Y1Y8_9PEZI|nr:uncharacterized protein B0I36DRAFT_329845 [Microdochium trichocladiopsis]KAH7026084.1 hypothetical protein B0I36DRAFT_329845 [Microdochium trichocladiopsis]
MHRIEAAYNLKMIITSPCDVGGTLIRNPSQRTSAAAMPSLACLRSTLTAAADRTRDGPRGARCGRAFFQ